MSSTQTAATSPASREIPPSSHSRHHPAHWSVQKLLHTTWLPYACAGTMFLLLCGIFLCRPPFLHAATLLPHAATCATAADLAHCEGHDPEVEQCVQNVKTLEAHPFSYQGIFMGTSQLRFSPVCNSYWLRVIEAPRASTGLSFVTIFTLFNTGRPQQVAFDHAIGDTYLVYSPMIFQQRPMPLRSNFGFTLHFANNTNVSFWGEGVTIDANAGKQVVFTN